MKFKWFYSEDKNYSIPDQILRTRNYPECFFDTSFENIPDISLMKDIKKAADRIIDAVKRKQKIMIFGHDDLDGITSTYILFDFLEKIGSQKHYSYIPNRLYENHGMQDNLIKKIKTGEYDLLITVDGGSSSINAVNRINALGCDVIITDHHLVPDELPDAYAIVNPKQEDCSYPYKMLAGVGVTYFLITQIAEILNMKTDKNYLFWTAIGSIADKVPLVGVNRIIVKNVLDNWLDFDDDNISFLQNYLDFNEEYYAKKKIIKYIIKLLSNGRETDGQNKSLKFLLAAKTEKSEFFHNLSDEVSKYEKKLNAVLSYLDEIKPDNSVYCFVHYDDDGKIPNELIGMSASYIAKANMIPAVILHQKGSGITAEARCTEGFNLVDAFKFCEKHLVQYGGHKKAAGFRTNFHERDKFIEKFIEYVELKKQIIRDNQKINIDAVIDTSQLVKINEIMRDDLDFLQPFGEGNPIPVFLIKDFIPERDIRKNRRNSLPFPEMNKNYKVVFNLIGNNINVIDYAENNQKSSGV